jgi:uncharacterized protein YwqG
MRNINLLARALAMPGVHIMKVDEQTNSHFGGLPSLPSSVNWPQWQGSRLAFLARISLTELQRAQQVPWLPGEGALLFFYDADEQPWGYDPGHKGSSVVLHVPDLDTSVALPDSGDDCLPRLNLAFQSIETLPSIAREQVHSESFSERELVAYEQLREAPFRGLPKHQIAGLPAPIQSDDMELECQLASNGLYCGDEDAWDDPRVAALAPGAGEWRLLLQVDSDDDAGVMWGDCGTLYFWVRTQDAAAGHFDDIWVVLQCG